MSFEGYYQVKCLGKISHYTTVDCYVYDRGQPCDVCGEPTISNLVDQTNGEDHGYEPLFEEGCDKLVSLWQSHVDEMRDDVIALIKAYIKYSPEDKLVDELMAKYQVTKEEL